MPEPGAAARRAGRPRNAAIDQAVLAAAWELLLEVGYPRLTLAAVAARAQAHTPAIYRRWASKCLLVVDSLARHLPPLPTADHGSLERDLTVLVRELASVWGEPRLRQSFIGLVADFLDEPEAERAFREQVVQPRGVALRTAIERAVARGEASAEVAPALVGDLVEGPLMHRALLTGDPLDDSVVAGIVAAATAALQTAGGAR